MTTIVKPGLSPAIGGGWTRPHPDILRDLPHWVYRLYDEDNELLYVGCTYLYPTDRIRALRNNNGNVWRAPIHHWKAHQYPDMDSALAAEGMWIDLVNPPLNGMRSGVAARRRTTAPRPVDEASGLLSSPHRVGANGNSPASPSEFSNTRLVGKANHVRGGF